MATCDFTPVPCPKKCKKDSSVLSMLRKDLKKHLEDCMNRDYECKLCGKKNTYANITGAHDDECEKKVLPCPNTECTVTMERADIKKHLNECEHTVISCKYKNLGCEVGLKRKEKEAMETHEQDDKVHLHRALSKLNDKPQQLDVVGHYYPYSSSKSYDLEYGRLKIYRNEEGGNECHVQVCLYYSWRNAFRSIRVDLLNQLEDKKHYLKTMEFNENGEIELKPFIHYSELSHDPVSNTQYLKDGYLYFRISSDDLPWKTWLKLADAFKLT